MTWVLNRASSVNFELEHDRMINPVTRGTSQFYYHGVAGTARMAGAATAVQRRVQRRNECVREFPLQAQSARIFSAVMTCSAEPVKLYLNFPALRVT
jgi:hypothetical protein